MGEWVGTYTDSVEGPFYREVATFFSGSTPGHQLPGWRRERPLFTMDGFRAGSLHREKNVVAGSSCGILAKSAKIGGVGVRGESPKIHYTLAE